MLNPHEISDATFPKNMRGYDVSAVKVFLKNLAAEVEQMKKRTASIEERNRQLEERISEYKKKEQNIAQTMIEARQMKSDIEAESKKRAEFLLHEAMKKAENVWRVKAMEYQELIKEIESLRDFRDDVVKKISSFFSEQITKVNALVDVKVEMDGSSVAKEPKETNEKHEAMSKPSSDNSNADIDDFQIEEEDDVTSESDPDESESGRERVEEKAKPKSTIVPLVDMDDYLNKL